MKRTSLLLYLFILTLASAAQNSISNEFVLSGVIKDCPKKVVYLGYADENGNRRLDSCLLQNDQFTFKGSINGPTFAFIKTNRELIPDAENKNIAALFLEPVHMT